MDKETKIISTQTTTEINAAKLIDSTAEDIAFSSSSIKFFESIKAVLFALLIGFVLIMITSALTEGARGDYGPLSFLDALWEKNFSTKMTITSFLSRMSYMVPLGLSLAVSFRMGIFNIGASGQSFAGGVFAFWIASILNVGKLGFLVSILAGIAMGMAIAFIITFLKTRFKINEVISSIMFNWIVFYIVLQVAPSLNTSSGLIEQNDLRFDFINELFAMGDSTIKVSKSLNLGVLIMIPLAILIWWAYSKTKWGYKQDLIGNNANVGKYVGIDEKKEMYKTMLLSGGLAGFAGTVYLLGFDNTLTGFESMMDIPGVTFDGITIALIGYSSPIGVIFSSAIFSIFNADGLDSTIGSYHIVGIILALMVIFVARSNLKVKYGGGK